MKDNSVDDLDMFKEYSSMQPSPTRKQGTDDVPTRVLVSSQRSYVSEKV